MTPTSTPATRPSRAEITAGMADSKLVVLRSRVARIGHIGHNSKLTGFDVLRAAPHVVTHVTGMEFDDPSVLLDLIRFGYQVEIQPRVENVGLATYYVTRDIATGTNKEPTK